MSTDPLQHLLERADGIAPPPTIAAGLASRVRRTAQRRVIRKNAAMVLSVAMACGVAIAVSRRFHLIAPRDGFPAARLAEIRTELAQLDADAQSHLRAAAALQQHRSNLPRAAITLERPTQPDALDRVDEARNRAALILLREADHDAADPQTMEQAHNLYFRAAGLFPDTPAGRLAAHRLKLTNIPT